MPVLCEALSVVVRRDSIDKHFQGGWEKFTLLVPNSTFCTDGELARVGFMAPNPMIDFIKLLQRDGLQFNQISDSKSKVREIDDIVVVDQIRGPTLECNWIEFGQLSLGEDKVSACWLFEEERKGYGTHFPSKQMTLATPRNWSPSDLTFVEDSKINKKLKFLRKEEGTDVFWDLENKKEVFIASS
jgi:hypothetical protein